MKEKQYFVYLTTNLINNKKYIGYHYGFSDDNYLGSGTIITNAIKKYGKDSFNRTILEFCDTENEVKEAEIKWIAFYNAVNSSDFYNIDTGGTGGMQGCQIWAQNNPELAYQNRIKNIEKARAWLKEHPDKQQQFLQKAHNKAQQWRIENPKKAQMNNNKLAQKGQEWYAQHPEQRQKNYQKLQEWYKNNPNQAQLIYQSNGKRLKEWYLQNTENRKEKIKIGYQKWKEENPEQFLINQQKRLDGYFKWREEHPEEYQKQIEKRIEEQGIPVRCIPTNEEFRTISEAARFYGLNASQISRVINGQRKHAGKLPDGTKLSWEKIKK